MKDNHCLHVAAYYEEKYAAADVQYKRTRKHKDLYARADYLRKWLTYNAGANVSIFEKDARM